MLIQYLFCYVTAEPAELPSAPKIHAFDPDPQGNDSREEVLASFPTGKPQ